MIFTANPLSLSLTDAAFDSWLRDSGHLEILDQRVIADTSAAFSGSSFIRSACCRTYILLSILTINPFSKLDSDDLSGQTPSWTCEFFGDHRCYTFPSESDQARRRIQENVKRYARNYLFILALFFACSLYQMPIAFIGVALALAMWEIYIFCNNKWRLEQYPVLQESLTRAAQFATAIILICLNVQMALLSSLIASYVAMMVHATFRKLAPVKTIKQPLKNRVSKTRSCLK